MRTSRTQQKEVVALLVTRDDGRIELRSPSVGLFRAAPLLKTVLTSGMVLGEIETLEVLVRVRAPDGTRGAVVEVASGGVLARAPVDYGAPLIVLDPTAAKADESASGTLEAAVSESSVLVFRSPSSGRYYGRSSPEAPPFVTEGAELTEGNTIALLEVMKTFHRVTYGGDALPERARVRRVIAREGEDIDAGAPILELEPV